MTTELATILGGGGGAAILALLGALTWGADA